MGNNNWNVSEPIDHTLIRALPQEVRDVKSATKHIIAKEHVEPSTSGAGGQHLQGSVRVYLSSTAPTSDPESNNLATSDTSDNGRIVVLTGSSNLTKVYVQTSAGISTGWQNLAVARVYADTAINMGGFKVEGIGTGTESGQAIHVGQLDTSYFKGISTGTIQLHQINTPSTFSDIASKVYVDNSITAAASVASTSSTTAASIVYPGGLIVQYFRFTSTSDGNEAFTFPEAFTTACVCVNCGPGIKEVSSVSKTGFTVNRFDDLDDSVTMHAVAVGY